VLRAPVWATTQHEDSVPWARSRVAARPLHGEGGQRLPAPLGAARVQPLGAREVAVSSAVAARLAVGEFVIKCPIFTERAQRYIRS
jgi:hypothetical protein